MNEAKIIFHNNCTTAIEGFSNGLDNIFNYSNKLNSGTSEEFKGDTQTFRNKKFYPKG